MVRIGALQVLADIADVAHFDGVVLGELPLQSGVERGDVWNFEVVLLAIERNRAERKRSGAGVGEVDVGEGVSIVAVTLLLGPISCGV